MKSIWLGQGGLLIISGKLKVVIDPYLSNSMQEYDRSMRRRLRIDKRFLRVKPDLLILTNSHADHADMKTVKKLL
jgi:L-ascorbate metabolism protein UlaG (beta-lactamase superfamily)